MTNKTKNKKKRTANKVLPKAGLNGFDCTFVQGSTFVLRLNFSSKSARLRQYPNRYIELDKLLWCSTGFSASMGIVDIFGGASRLSSLSGETVQVRSIPLVDVSRTSQRLDEVSRYQPQNQALTDKKNKKITIRHWISLLAFQPQLLSRYKKP